MKKLPWNRLTKHLCVAVVMTILVFAYFWDRAFLMLFVAVLIPVVHRIERDYRSGCRQCMQCRRRKPPEQVVARWLVSGSLRRSCPSMIVILGNPTFRLCICQQVSLTEIPSPPLLRAAFLCFFFIHSGHWTNPAAGVFFPSHRPLADGGFL